MFGICPRCGSEPVTHRIGWKEEWRVCETCEVRWGPEYGLMTPPDWWEPRADDEALTLSYEIVKGDYSPTQLTTAATVRRNVPRWSPGCTSGAGSARCDRSERPGHNRAEALRLLAEAFEMEDHALHAKAVA